MQFYKVADLIDKFCSRKIKIMQCCKKQADIEFKCDFFSHSCAIR